MLLTLLAAAFGVGMIAALLLAAERFTGGRVGERSQAVADVDDRRTGPREQHDDLGRVVRTAVRPQPPRAAG